MKARDVVIALLAGAVVVLVLNLMRGRRSAELEDDRDRLVRALAHH